MKKLQINWLLWIQGLLFVAIVIAIFKAVINIEAILSVIGTFLGIISPIILAATFAYMLGRPCRWVEKWIGKANHAFFKKRARGLAVFSVYIVVLSVIYAVLSFLFPLLINNTLDFIDFIPDLYAEIESLIVDIEWDALDEVFIDIQSTINVHEAMTVQEVIESFFANFDIQTFIGPVTQGIGAITNFAISTVLWLFNFILALIISIYILLYKDAIFATTGRIANLVMKRESVQTLKYYTMQADDLFYKFIGAQFLDACIMGGSSIVLLALLNVRFAVFLGILLGIANMIPKFGSIFASVFVIGLTFITGNVNQGIWTAILLTALQQFDGNVIGPMIMGDALKINPILVFFSLLVGAYFGIIGMFVSIPVMALVKIIIINIIEAKESKKHHFDQVARKIGEQAIPTKAKG